MEMVRMARWHYPVSTLGPGNRAVLWVKGCPFRCQGCIVPEWQPTDGGDSLSVDSLADLLLGFSELSGITISGGEPMLQAEPLAQLVKELRKRREIDVICFTGYTWEWLQHSANPWHGAFLKQIDLLIDGLYLPELQADLLWRGSSNQRLIPLTEKYRPLVEELTPETDKSAGLEFLIGADGTLSFAGVPTRRGFRKELEMQLEKQGVRLL